MNGCNIDVVHYFAEEATRIFGRSLAMVFTRKKLLGRVKRELTLDNVLWTTDHNKNEPSRRKRDGWVRHNGQQAALLKQHLSGSPLLFCVAYNQHTTKNTTLSYCALPLFSSTNMAKSKEEEKETAEKQDGAAWMDPGYDEEHQRSFPDLEEGDQTPLLQDKDKTKDNNLKDKDYGSAPPKRNEEGLASEKTKAIQTSRPHIPNQNPILWLIHLINGAAVIASLSLILTQIVPYLANPAGQTKTFFLMLNFILKFYIVLFCVVFLLVEIDVPLPFTRNSPMLQRFASRGFLYSFIGLISTVESYSDRVQSFLEKSTNGWCVV